MTVLVAVAGEAGDDATTRLRDEGVSTERVRTLADARVRAATATVVVTGPLADASAKRLRFILNARSSPPPLVSLAETDDFADDIAHVDDDLVAAVHVAEYAAAYNDAIDTFFERSRAGSDTAAARERADRTFTAARTVVGRPPFEALLDGVRR